MSDMFNKICRQIVLESLWATGWAVEQLAFWVEDHWPCNYSLQDSLAETFGASSILPEISAENLRVIFEGLEEELGLTAS